MGKRQRRKDQGREIEKGVMRKRERERDGGREGGGGRVKRKKKIIIITFTRTLYTRGWSMNGRRDDTEKEKEREKHGEDRKGGKMGKGGECKKGRNMRIKRLRRPRHIPIYKDMTRHKLVLYHILVNLLVAHIFYLTFNL